MAYNRLARKGMTDMLTVKEVSKLTGVSVRTLHYYDEIGLLKPDNLTEAGYRLYGGEALSRLQNILMFRELQFSLKEIKNFLESPDFNREEAISHQIKLLELQYKHIGELISFARDIQSKGGNKVNFEIFNKDEIEQYKAEAKARWGDTQAYKEYKVKTDSLDFDAGEFMQIFAKFGELRGTNPAEQRAQDEVRELQNFISENFYTCTDEILAQLADMYVCDGRFKKNIDSVGGEGTAEFVKQAIYRYCGK